MSKKHFIAIAANIQDVKLQGILDPTAAVEQVAQQLADVFEDDNPRFDRQQFLTACGF